MRKSKAAKLAASGALAMFLATGAFAAERGDQWQQGRQDQWQRQDQYQRADNNRRDERREHLRGFVTRVDYRDGFATVRQEGSRKLVRVDINDLGRQRIRRGDFVTFEGQWARGGMFAAYRIEGR